MRCRASFRPFLVSLVVTALAGVVACAEGDTPDLGAGTPQITPQPEPTTPGQQLPPSNPPGGEDSGEGTSSSGGSSSGGTDASAEAAADAAVDAAKDAAPDVVVTCATVAPSNACGLSPQCGCAANQTCDVTNTSNGSVSCVLAGAGTLGSYCTSTTQCAKGFACGYNACRPHCSTVGAACAGAGLGECTEVYAPGAAAPIPNSKVCTVACDLLAPAAACGSNNCIWDTTIDAADCDKSGTLEVFDACTRYNECQQGLACVDHPFFGLECEPWCRLGQNDCAALGADCIDVYGAAAPMKAGMKLGHCQ